MMCGLYAIFFLSFIPYSLSGPDPAAKPLDTININLNLGDNEKGGKDYAEGQSRDYQLYHPFNGYGPGAGMGAGVGAGAGAGVGAGVGAGIGSNLGAVLPGQPPQSPSRQPQEQTQSGGDLCPMDESIQMFKDQGCRCGSENCNFYESCAKFNTSKNNNGNFDKNCTTGSTACINRCKQPGKLCRGGTGHPSFCTCDDGTRDVDNRQMCPNFFTGLLSCTCPDGKVITETPNGADFMAPDVWVEPARDADN